MESTVNDFLNEINEIAPLCVNKQENLWEKCFDDNSGYYYYWNVNTNDVTWEQPSGYKSPRSDAKSPKRANNRFMSPRTAPLFPSASNIPHITDSVKIYKIGECTPSDSTSENKNNTADSTKFTNKNKTAPKTPYKPQSDSDDEKIVLISSYADDSESDEEMPVKPKKVENGAKKSPPKSEDDIDILPKNLNEIKDIEEVSHTLYQQAGNAVASKVQKSKKEISGFSLVAGYSDSEDDEPDSDTEQKLPIIVQPTSHENKISHSTLFPITKPIDVKDFELKTETSCDGDEDNFDSKAFQRKRRIGIALINTKKMKTDHDDDGGDRKGFGFEEFSSETNSLYPGFKSGGVMFVKADVLNPTINDDSERIRTEIEETYTALKEKLGFLSEGHSSVSPVQVMTIQIETLMMAAKSGDLKQNYLRKWLDDTCSELIKLEKETTPDGWLLQWDRSHKRYYYQNEATGESQWEYPEVDVNRCDEAMDISTTPPPCGAEQAIHMLPPLPPTIASPSPPPPPTISEHKKKKCDIPLPPEPKTTEKCDSNGEPLPPGVDLPEVANSKLKDNEKNKKDNLSDALSSFYSDIAAIENCDSPPPSVSNEEKKTEPEIVGENAKKKKKTKVKMAQGIAMKKKGVSKLVEKWKHVQLSYND